jgi:hypothetical protein
MPVQNSNDLDGHIILPAIGKVQPKSGKRYADKIEAFRADRRLTGWSIKLIVCCCLKIQFKENRLAGPSQFLKAGFKISDSVQISKID